MSDARWTDARAYGSRDRSEECRRVYDVRDRDEHDPRHGVMRDLDLCRDVTSGNWSLTRTELTSWTAKTAGRLPPSVRVVSCRNMTSSFPCDGVDCRDVERDGRRPMH
jgi:hypothetical protein